MVLAHRPVALPHRADEPLAVHRVLHRQADAVVVEGLLVRQHGDGLERGALHLDDRHRGIPLERPDEGHRHLEDHLDVPARQGSDLRGGLGKVHLPQLVEIRLPGIPVVGVPHHAGAVARSVLGDPERPGSRGLRRELVRAVRGHDAAERRAQRQRQVGVRRAQAEPDRPRVDRLDLLDRPQHRTARRRGLGVQDALHAEHDVLGGQGLAVMELDARTQGEGPGAALVVSGPAGGQLRLGLKLLVDADEVVEHVLHDHVLVALDGEGRIQGARRAQPGLLDDAALPRRLGGHPPGERSRHRRQRRSGGAQPEEPPAREPAHRSLPSRSVARHGVSLLRSPPHGSTTAKASISTSSSGRASELTTRPVLQWCTPSKCRAMTPYTAGRNDTSVM